MRRLLVAVIALVALTGCLPQMNGGGWAWDPSPAQPILIDSTSGVGGPGAIEAAAGRMNGTAGIGIMAAGAFGAASNVDFQPLTPICPYGDAACTSRRHMWVFASYQGQASATQSVPGAYYADHCTVFYDPTMTSADWSSDVIWHELWHCLMYPDVSDGAGGYNGVLDAYGFYDRSWRARWWGGADDRAMLARDGYGP